MSLLTQIEILEAENARLREKLEQADEGLANAYSSARDDSRRNDIACERNGLQRAAEIVRRALSDPEGRT